MHKNSHALTYERKDINCSRDAVYLLITMSKVKRLTEALVWKMTALSTSKTFITQYEEV